MTRISLIYRKSSEQILLEKNGEKNFNEEHTKKESVVYKTS